MNDYNSMGKGSKKEYVEKGSFEKRKTPKFKDGENINADVPKLPQIKGKTD